MFDFANMDFEFDLDSSSDTQTNNATLDIVEEQLQLFFSAEWKLVARVNGAVIEYSPVKSAAHSQDQIKHWARDVICKHDSYLRILGVDVDAAYVKYAK